jgi:hypothetical protein
MNIEAGNFIVPGLLFVERHTGLQKKKRLKKQAGASPPS